jgi:seryl-tRNA synthetase
MNAIDQNYQEACESFQRELTEAGLLIPTGVRGVYARNGVFEGIVERFEQFVTHMGAHLAPEVIHFPPVLNRRNYLKTDHLATFPQLLGSVHTFCGGDHDHAELLAKKEQGQDWTRDLAPTEVVLAPAACYALYPLATGTVPANGRTVDLRSFVFRHEPSSDPARMQIFRMREYVRIGSPQQALAHRNYWIERAEEVLHAVGLQAQQAVANDPFFGKAARLMAATQREQALKYELLVPVASEEKPTAVASCNYHQDHFGKTFAIRTPDGLTAHTACMGFGLERVALALFKRHGLKPAQWPANVKQVLGL